MSDWEKIAKEFGYSRADVMATGAQGMAEEIAKLREDLKIQDDANDILERNLAEVTKERDAARMVAEDEMNAKWAARKQLAASEAREVVLRAGLEKALAAWKSIDTPKPWSIHDAIDDALSSTSPPPILGVLREAEEAFQYVLTHSPGTDGDVKNACLWCDMGGAGYSTMGDGHHDDVRDKCPVLKCSDALASLRVVIGVRG